MLFEMDHCVLSVLDADINLSFDMHVRPPYAAEQGELHGPEANAAVGLDTIQEENDNMHDANHVQAHSSNASKIKEEKSVKKEIDQSEIQAEEAKDSKVQKNNTIQSPSSKDGTQVPAGTPKCKSQ